MEKVKSTDGDRAELLMECDEEKQEVVPLLPERNQNKQEREGHDEDMESAVSLMKETNPPPVRIIPIPVQPVSSCTPPPLSNSQKSSGAPVGFTLNGRFVPMLPGGGGAELNLCSHPGGTASGFTTVQIPVTLTVQSPAGTQHINTTASLTATSTTAPTNPPAACEHEAEPTPIITGVVSGEAAQRVLSNHNVDFKSSPSLTGPKSPPSAPVSPRASPLTLTSLQPTPTAPQRTKTSKRRPVVSDKLLRKGQLGPVSPPDCLVCMSHYKFITELRGFMCLCSPAIAKSLKDLKRRRNHHSRSKDKYKSSKTSKDPQTSSKVSKTRSGLSARTHRPPEDLLSHQFTSPAMSSTTCSPQQDQSALSPDPPHGKLVIMVEDFYYGSAPGQSSIKPSTTSGKFTGPYRCIHCSKTLRNNIKLMSHMQQHVKMMFQQDGDLGSQSSCPHCFRSFLSPFKLQCHVEAVHSQYESTAKCKICELEFGSEPAFLWHMKNTHKPGEMPYVCQVCGFKSSFYSDVWSHFHRVHADTSNLLCQYCLRVLRSNTCYQQHFVRHQKKHVFSCDKCRLHFLYVKERMEHKVHHRTHIRPPQLTGLKPGTKVTVRTYSVIGGSENDGRPKKTAPCKVVDVDPPPPPPTQEVPRRKPVETLGPLLSSLNWKSEAEGVSRLSQHCVECLSSFQDFRSHFPSRVHCSLCRFITCCSTSYANHMINNHANCRKNPQYNSIFLPDLSEAEGVSRPSQRCVECLSSFQDFRSHFPSRVHCSLCRFITCCSTSYANHMINNHANCRKNPQYNSIFLPDPRFSQRLRCVSCTVSTCRGDVMANHLTERPEHQCCIMLTHREPSGHSVEAQDTQPADHSSRAISSSGQGGGTFIPIHLLPSGQTSTKLSVKTLTCPSSLSSPPAMTITFLGPRPQPESLASPLSAPLLSASQLSVVLFSLCHGLSQASQRFQMSPLKIRSWTQQQERQLLDRKWHWRTEKVAEWVLSQREQQLIVKEDVLLQTARSALGEDSSLTERYSWTVDFMLRHKLGLPPYKHHRGRLPRSIRDNSHNFIHLVSTKIHSIPPHRVGSMDEFSIFVDLDRFSDQKPSAFRMFGSSEDIPMFDVVLSALSDGTFLPPLLFFRGTLSQFPEGFPDNVLLEAQWTGFTEQEHLRIWINKVWRPRVASQCTSVLLVDVHRGHMKEKFRSSLTAESTDIVFIPPGCCCRLQPLDVCVMPVLREFLQAQWTQLVSRGGLDGLGLDQLALTLACWLSEVSSTLNSETHVLRRSFASVFNPQEGEDRGEAVKLIQALTEALVQPLETSVPPSHPELELLLVMEEKQKHQQQQEEEEVMLKSSSALRQVFEGESDPESFHGFQDDSDSSSSDQLQCCLRRQEMRRDCHTDV